MAQQRLASSQPGWEPLEEAGPHPLSRVGFFEGHPRGLASLAPDDADARGPTSPVSTWTFVGGDKKDIWLACYYDRTSLILARRLDPRVRR